MAEVVLWHTVPVAVHIDLETRQVERVVVIDDELSVNDRDEQYQFLFRDGGVLTEDEYDTANKITEDPDVEWPSWQFGY